MTRNFGAMFSVMAFVLGGLAIAWVGMGYITSNPLALLMTALIGAFYGMGGLELRRFHQATATLAQALATIPAHLPSLGGWLNTIHPSLQNPVRLRIEGERVVLPGPAMTPYLVGLLVLLGMLGTFLGMVVTLNGAVMALETTTDLPAMRAALAAPVRGLGLAFGTSVAGVAGSAMLGLVSALCRRDRLQTAQLLDSHIASQLRGFSVAQRQQAERQASRQANHDETLKTLQLQAQVLPEVATHLASQVAGQLHTMMAQMERQHLALADRLLAGQDSFHQHAQSSYAALASSVGQSLKDSLASSARLASATLQPVVQATMAGISREAAQLHEKVANAVQLQLDAVSDRFGNTVSTVTDGWATALTRQERSSAALQQGLHGALTQFNATFAQGASGLLASAEQGHAALQAGLASADQQRQLAWAQSLQAVAVSLQQGWQQAGAQSQAQQDQLCKTLAQTASGMHSQADAHAKQLLGEMAGLMQAAAEAPRAAAEMTTLLRQKLSDSMARDNDLLDERSRIMAALASALAAVQQASSAQHGAVDGLVASSAAVLQQASHQFSDTITSTSGKLTDAAAHITGSAVEVASLGESFGAAVQLFSASNTALMAQLQRIEVAMGKASTRSDAQLAYYVAQARDIIDLSLLSQQQMVEGLQHAASSRATPVGEVA